ncbi:MAG: nitroreductase [Clostridia bacterium]|nr:nitroreductase [Clostridia bacterium]
MDLKEAILSRHSVRSYIDKPIEGETLEKLNAMIEECNREGDLHIQLVTDEPKAFDCFLAHYGKFKDASNYIALVGKDSKDFYEKIGYYGEKLVLYAQTLGLNTCWVYLTYKKVKNAYVLNKGEKLGLVITVGYGETQGKSRNSKTLEDVSAAVNPPEWYLKGIEAALLAPTAMNKQKFFFSLEGNKVKMDAASGVCATIDSGIVKCHFEIGAGKENFEWA